MTDILRITLLGTGTPFPNPNAFGTCTLIEAGKEKVLLDCGRGTTIRLCEAGHSVGSVNRVFLSHYHSDHYAGIFDLLMTGAIPQRFANRAGPLHVHGPKGLDHVVNGAWEASTPDREIRVADGEIDPDDMRMVPHEFEEGTVFDENDLKIIAIKVDHGEYIKPAYAFRVEYRGKVFVHSHDTRYNENLISKAKGADVFVHEVATAKPETLAAYPPIKVALDHHTTPKDVGRVFAQTKPRLAVLTHMVLLPPDPVSIETVVEEIGETYKDPIIVGEDLMTIQIGQTISVIPFRNGTRR